MRKTVHVIYKTHFDYGFTDHAEDVLSRYMTQYIPAAVETALALNKNANEPKFIWTLGAFLVDYYLQNATEAEQSIMKKAIKSGSIVWHGLPYTFHSELADPQTFDFALSISKKLNQQFQRKTIAAKMTDVPGHTKAIIKPLAQAGIKFLHIGVNGASAVPDVPRVFRWRDDEGYEIIVAYDGDYGQSLEIEGFNHVLHFCHTHDNRGPQNALETQKLFEAIQTSRPNDYVIASTLDDYAKALESIQHMLPLVTDEIGDSWIHGVASDPYKVAAYRALMRLRSKWIKQDSFKNFEHALSVFDFELMSIPEHTWGMDIKRHLFDFKNYEKAAFKKAREIDLVDADASFPAHHAMQSITIPELAYTSKSWDNRRYSLYEHSWAEKRAHIDKAIDALPKPLKQEAKLSVDSLRPETPRLHEGSFLEYVGKTLTLGDFKVRIGSDGAICYLEAFDGSVFADAQHPLAHLHYEAIGHEQYNEWWKNYTRNIAVNHVWCYGDFGKPGLELVTPKRTSKNYDPIVIDTKLTRSKDSDELTISLRFDEDAYANEGAPKWAKITYQFGSSIGIEVDWYNKEANRMPEAIWLTFNPFVSSHATLSKIGTPIDPSHIVENGGTMTHAVTKDIILGNNAKHVKLETYDAAVVALGTPEILHYKSRKPSFEGGIHFNLFNNVWGTNFVMWYEDNARFRFTLTPHTQK